MSKIALTPNASGTGTFTIASPNSNTDRTLTLPDAAGTVLIEDGSGNVAVTGDLTIADKIVHSGDTNTAVRFPAADTVTVETAGSERLRIDSSRNVGIGTSSPTSNLSVIGTYNQVLSSAGYANIVENTSTAGSGIYNYYSSLESTSNNANCAHFRATTQAVNTWLLLGNGTSTFSSDERLKKNIETTRDGYLSDLAQLRVVKYNWHTDEDGTPKELGLVAQEVEQVFPGLVMADDIPIGDVENPKAIKTSVLPYMLLKALQEALTKIETLEARVAALEGASA